MYTPSYQTTTKPRGILRPPTPPPSSTSRRSSVSSTGSSTPSSRRVRFDRHDTTHPKTASSHKVPRRSSRHESQSQKGKRGPSVSTRRSVAPLHGKTPSKHYERRVPDEHRRHEHRRHTQQTPMPHGYYIRGHAPAYHGLYRHGYGNYHTHTQEMHRRHQQQQHYAQLSAMAVQQQMDQRRLRRHQQQQIYMYEQQLQQQYGRRHRGRAF
ncbi:unnamed protein product [Chondrus crispus]|uniref:Uncharacterized protein n=1 Tax=Chondrus crispus TaxID=2769 RepID=R7Q796_CHOCR|nr:unnamed protein product [Chondrus crispus]CDF34402.1 unnamed protein product [Chondrus crispus]|eukprot:XP_005714221.1 unnamed protein product [Chondrus crispus]